ATIGVTFAEAFDAFFTARRCTLSNPKHVQQWENTMRTYMLPHIGRRPVAEIGSSEVLSVLQQIWFKKPETASRVLQRMWVVFESAILRGSASAQIPALA